MTTAQAIVRWLIAQRTILANGEEAPLFPGLFGIFGHGNVTCLGHALEEMRDELPTWRGQNEQGMALAGVAYAKAVKARQIMDSGAEVVVTNCFNCNSQIKELTRQHDLGVEVKAIHEYVAANLV